MNPKPTVIDYLLIENVELANKRFQAAFKKIKTANVDQFIESIDEAVAAAHALKRCQDLRNANAR